jgi:hypothetical protein
MAVDLTEEAVRAGRDVVANANSATLFKDVGLKAKKSTGEITSRQASSVDQAFAEISPTENPPLQMEAAASTLTPVVASNPEDESHQGAVLTKPSCTQRIKCSNCFGSVFGIVPG